MFFPSASNYFSDLKITSSLNMLLLLNSPAENDWCRSNTLYPLAVHSHLGRGLTVISREGKEAPPWLSYERACPSPTFEQVGSNLMGNLTIIWISLLHTWRSCSSWQTCFKAILYLLRLSSPETRWQIHLGEKHTHKLVKCVVEVSRILSVAAGCWCHC